MPYQLSVLIPARDEVIYDIDLLASTITNVLENSSDATEVIAVLDGYTPPSLVQHPRVTYIHHNKSIGQRAATNEAAAVSRAKYVMKLDAHCALSKDFDTVLMRDMQPNWTVCPAQYNLVAYVWKCKKCGWLKDQAGWPKGGPPRPDKCGKCGSQYVKQVKQWFPRDGREGSDVDKKSGRRNAYLSGWRFDTNLEYQQWGALAQRFKEPIHDTMSLLGACWMLERERYYDLDICDVKYGSWGQQGTEIACKSFLSGGELKVNTNAWFAHFFRVGGLWFPYSGGGQKERAMARCREMWLENKWPKQIHPLSWLIDKFSPPDWTTEGNKVAEKVRAEGEKFYKERGIKREPTSASSLKSSVGVIYYTCSTLSDPIATAVRNNLKACTNGHEVGCVSRERLDFGDWNIVVDMERGPLAMHEQILAGLERSKADYVFLTEHDILYHPSHFDFIPPRDDVYYYNTNVWRVRYDDGHAVRTDDCKQVSGLCASRELLLQHYRKRVERIRKEGFSRKNGYEPGTRHLPNGYDNTDAESWSSPFPNLDIRHGKTLTGDHWTIDSFRNKKYAAGWKETDEAIEGWPKLSDGGLQQLLTQLSNNEFAVVVGEPRTATLK